MEAFQIVIAIQRPVALHHIVPRVRRIVAKLVKRQPPNAVEHRRKLFFEGLGRIERSKQQRPPLMKRHRSEMILRPRKTLDPFKLGHVLHLPVQPKSPPVVPTPQKPLIPRPLAKPHPPVSADITQTPNTVLCVPSQNERLIQITRQKLKRINLPRHLDHRVIANKLPALSEVLFFPLGPNRRIGVVTRRQSRSLSDFRIDVIAHHTIVSRLSLLALLPSVLNTIEKLLMRHCKVHRAQDKRGSRQYVV